MDLITAEPSRYSNLRLILGQVPAEATNTAESLRSLLPDSTTLDNLTERMGSDYAQTKLSLGFFESFTSFSATFTPKEVVKKIEAPSLSPYQLQANTPT